MATNFVANVKSEELSLHGMFVARQMKFQEIQKLLHFAHWPLTSSVSMLKSCVHCNFIIFATVFRALMRYNSVAENYISKN